MKKIEAEVRLLYVSPENAEEVIAQNRWFCKKNTRENPTEIEIRRSVKSVLSTAHIGLLEHCIASVEIDLSRVASHQLVRHRLASYAQESQRSSQQEPEVILPEYPPEILDRVLLFLDSAYDMYSWLLSSGIKYEDARYILPQCFATKIRVTANFRTWIHFLRLRLDPSAQEEIRRIAEQIQVLFEGVCPLVFSRESIAGYREVPE